MWNAHSFNNVHPHAPIGAAAGRMKPVTWQRPPLPTPWFEQPPPLTTGSLYPPPPPLPPGNGPIGQALRRLDPPPHMEGDEDLIPTAIVIKNIPFAVKKEQLVQLMTELHLPLPYAFNYHFDHGVFRGLAFANFTTAEETAIVIEHLNHFELQGRKLRVEYKKMLPQQERERIEREKRERRGQLEEQHRPLPPTRLQNQPSLSSITSHVPNTSPSPLSTRNPKLDVDLNDPQTLQFYSQLLLFRDDLSREALIFPSALSPAQRRTVHTLAHHMGLAHVSRGTGEHRQVHVVRAMQTGANLSPPLPTHPISIRSSDAHRRSLNRAATIDFGEARVSDVSGYGTLGRQPSGFLDLPTSPGFGGSMSLAAQNLRGAKSFADLRSYTPSPVPSTASFPASHGLGMVRYPDPTSASSAASSGVGGGGGGGGGPGGMSSLTPTLPSLGGASGNRDDILLSGGLGGLSLGAGLGIGQARGTMRDPRSMLTGEREPYPQSFGGPIGGHRNFSGVSANGGNVGGGGGGSIINNSSNGLGGYEEMARDRGGQGSAAAAASLRHPRGPLAEKAGAANAAGFPRNRQSSGHQTRGSDESSMPAHNVEILVE